MKINYKKLCGCGSSCCGNQVSPDGTKKKILSLAVTSLLFSILATPVMAQDVWVTGYYPAFNQYQANYMPPEQINYNALTHIVIYGITPNSSGGLIDDSDVHTSTFGQRVITGAHNAGKKVLLCIGGQGSKYNFLNATDDITTRATLINNIINFVTTYGYDGVDIDWEPFSSTEDGAAFTSFITELHNRLNSSLLLTTATSDEYLDPGIRTINANLQDKFDQINLMSYDIAFNYPGWVTWHSSPLYNGNYTFPDDTRKLPSIEEWVQNYINAGVAPSKIGIGMGFHGQIWSGGSGTSTGGATTPQQSWTTAPAVVPDQPYIDIINNYYTTSRYHYDSVAESPYLSIDNTGSTSDKFISYEDESSIAAKFNYIRNKNIGGAIVWHLAQDYFGPGNQPLTQAVANELVSIQGQIVNFTTSAQSVSENVGTAAIIAQLSAVLDVDVTVPYTINTSSTATGGGVDHNLAAGSISIPAGETTGSVSFSVFDDTQDESNETVVVSMGTPTNVNKGGMNVHTVTIVDNDDPTVSFSATSQTVAESIGTVTVTAQLSAANGSAVTVPFTVSGTATGGGKDYTLSSSSITIAAGQTSGKVTFTVNNDILDENDETVIFFMGTPTNAKPGATNVHTVTITDNDNQPTVNFSASTQSKTENAGTATITAKLSAASGKEVSVPFSINSSSTAKNPNDYTVGISSITIPVGSTEGTATINIINDTLDEASETVIVNMGGTPTNATAGTTKTHTLTITDDDNPPTVAFTSSSQTVAESGNPVTISASLSTVSGLNVSVPFSIAKTSTAINGTDYKLSATSISIPAGQQAGSVTFTPIKDTNTTESSETAILTIGTPTNATKVTPSTHTVTITNG